MPETGLQCNARKQKISEFIPFFPKSSNILSADKCLTLHSFFFFFLNNFFKESFVERTRRPLAEVKRKEKTVCFTVFFCNTRKKKTDFFFFYLEMFFFSSIPHLYSKFLFHIIQKCWYIFLSCAPAPWKCLTVFPLVLMGVVSTASIHDGLENPGWHLGS